MAENRDRILMLVLAACVAALFFSLNNRALWDPDEGRYAEMAREILVLNDWVTPHLNGLVYFEKPMMYMWLEAVSFKAFGVSEWAARLVSLLSALGGAALVGFMAKRLWGSKAGLIAALCLMTSAEYFVLADAVDINMTLTLFITAAFVFFRLGHVEGKPGYLLLFWASMACATLTKGPIGLILPMGAIGLFILMTRRFDLIANSKPVSGGLVYLAITLPWFMIVSMRNPGFFSFFFIDQNLLRYTVSHEHNQPIFYFLVVILAGALPWTFLFPSAVKELWKNRASHDALYIAVWFAFVLGFFSLSSSKLATYVLPCFPPLALFMAYAFHHTPARARMPLALAGALWAFLGATLMVLPVMVSKGIVPLSANGIEPLLHSGTMMGAIILAGAIASFLVGARFDNISGTAFMGMIIMITALIFSTNWDSVRSTESLVQGLPAHARLFAYRTYYPSSSFYTHKQVGLVDYRGELDLGVRHKPQGGAVLTLEQLNGFLDTDSEAYCLTQKRHLAELKKKIPEITVVRQAGKLCLVAVPHRQISRAENLPPIQQQARLLDRKT